MKILLIDDEPILFKDVLGAYGYAVDVAVNGYQGLKLLHEHGKTYDLIILDIKMPLINGFEMLEAIRKEKEWKHIFVLMLTANDAEDSFVAGLTGGADLYVTKPISPVSFISQIKAIERRLDITKRIDQDISLTQDDTRLNILTRRENQIISLVCQGLSNKQIAEQLILSETTIKNHVANIFKKMKVQNRTQATFMFNQMHHSKGTRANEPVI